MGSVYQLETGEVVDLCAIQKIGNVVEKSDTRYMFDIVFATGREEIVINPSLASEEVKEAYHNKARSLNKYYNPKIRFCFRDVIDEACDAGKEAYKKFCEDMRASLIDNWVRFKKEKMK